MFGQPHQRRVKLHQGPLRNHVSHVGLLSREITLTHAIPPSLIHSREKVPAPDGGVSLLAVEDVARAAPPRESHAEDDVRGRRELDVEGRRGDHKHEKEVGGAAPVHGVVYPMCLVRRHDMKLNP